MGGCKGEKRGSEPTRKGGVNGDKRHASGAPDPSNAIHTVYHTVQLLGRFDSSTPNKTHKYVYLVPMPRDPQKQYGPVPSERENPPLLREGNNDRLVIASPPVASFSKWKIVEALTARLPSSWP